MIEVENRMQGEIAVIALLRFVSAETARDAAEEVLQLLSEAKVKTLTRGDLFLPIKAVKRKEGS